MRCIYQSLAMKYKHTFNMLRKMGKKEYRRINILGGGIKDRLLCQMAADACNAEVLAGPSEATVMGNIAVCFAALGEIADFAGIRKTVYDSTELKYYEPKENAAWEQAYEDYLKVINYTA